MKRITGLICIILIIALFTGCASKTESHGYDEISKISKGAGTLAYCVEQSGGFIAGKSDSNPNAAEHAYTYDNAVALIALANAGADWHALTIADAILFAQDHDRMFQDGRLRNAYVSGDPKSDSGRSIVGKKVTVRLPGFWQDGRWQEDYYTVSTSSGNMAWVILALCKASEIAPEDNKEIYINGAKRAADFLLTLRADNGGFSGGYEGWDENQVLATYKSTEHNIDIACAYRLLASVIEETDQVKANEYIEASEYAKQFVFSMYDSKLHCFYTGTADDGKTRSEGVVPLDANSLAILAFGNDLADKDKILEFIEKRISVDDGYDFSAGDGDGIWNEGTAQMALCYAGTGDKELYGSILSYLDSQTDEEGIMPAANRDGLSTGFLLGGTGDIWEFNNEESISATAWYSLAQMAVNPFAM